MLWGLSEGSARAARAARALFVCARVPVPLSPLLSFVMPNASLPGYRAGVTGANNSASALTLILEREEGLRLFFHLFPPVPDGYHMRRLQLCC